MKCFFSVFTVLLIFISCSGSESDDSSILSENLSSQDFSSNETSSSEENNQSDASETATNQSEGNQTENSVANDSQGNQSENSESNNESQANQSENSEQEEGLGKGGSSSPSKCSNFIGKGPDFEWIKSVEGSQEEAHAHFIFTTNDNGYIQVGETGFLDNNTAKILVAKTNSQGDLIWKKEFGDPGHNLGNSVIEVSDGYIVTGALNKNSTVIKLEKSNGDQKWLKTYDNGGNDAIEHIVETPDGLVAVGYINAVDENNTFYTEGTGYITFIDSEGNKTSGKNLDTKMSHGYRVYRINDNLIISGLTPGAEDYALMKTNLSGDQVWVKTYGGDNMDHCFAMDISNDNSIYLSGHTLSGVQNWDSYTMKIDIDGNKLWEKKRGNPRGFNPLYIHDEVWDLKATDDGGCIIVAGTGDEYAYEESCAQSKDLSNVWQVYLIKFSSSGEIQWDKTYAPVSGDDWAGEAIDITSDGGAVIAVDNSQFGILKIAPINN